MAIYETPSVTGQSRGSFVSRLKSEFMAAWDDNVHKKTVVADKIAKKKGTMGGLETLGSVCSALPQSAGVALFEDSPLPVPTSSTYFQPKAHARSMYTRLRLTGAVERAARRGDKSAWAQPRKEDMKNADAQLRINFARMLYLGPYQPMATVASFNGTTTATLYGRNARRSDTDNLWKFGAHYLRVGMAIDWVNSSGSAVNVTGDPQAADDGQTTEVRITAIGGTESAPTVTFSLDPSTLTSVADPDDEAIIIPYGSRRDSLSTLGGAVTDATFYAGPNGLMQICGDANVYAKLYDLARSSYPTLSGVRETNSGNPRTFDEHLIALGVDNIVDNGVGDEPDMMLMNRAIRREYTKQSAGDRRFAAVQKEKGFSGKLSFTAGDAELPIITDRDCPPGLVFILNSADFGWLSESELGPVDETGERFVADRDAHEIVLHKSGNEICEKPFNSGTIEDIEYDVYDLVS